MSNVPAVKVLVVLGPLAQEQLGVFRACARIGAEIRIIGCLSGPRSYKWWSDPAGNDPLAEALPPIRLGHDYHGWLYRGLAPRVSRFVPDVIHVESEPWGLLVEQALWSGRPVVAHGAENQSYRHGSRGKAVLRRVLAKRHLHRLAGFASWNQAGIGLALQHGLPSGVPLLVAPAAVSDPDPFLKAGYGRASLKFHVVDGQVRSIGFVGRLTPPKGLRYLIDAVALLRRDDVELVVAGVGPAKEELEVHARSAGIRARFLGLVPLSQVHTIMASVDVMAVPSVTTPEWAEQFGRVVVESMFAGTPLIVSDSGSLPEVAGGAAIVVPERDAAALADAIDGILQSPESSRELAESARNYALRRFHPDRIAEQLVGFWSQVSLRAPS